MQRRAPRELLSTRGKNTGTEISGTVFDLHLSANHSPFDDSWTFFRKVTIERFRSRGAMGAFVTIGASGDR